MILSRMCVSALYNIEQIRTYWNMFRAGRFRGEQDEGEQREQKRRKKRYGHKVRGRSVQTLQRIILDKAGVERERVNQGRQLDA